MLVSTLRDRTLQGFCAGLALIALAGVLILIAIQDTRTPATARDPRKHPLTVENALFTIPDVKGRMVLAGDLDGDDVRDLVVRRGGGESNAPQELAAVSGRNGTTIRTLWTFETRPAYGFESWDADGDANGDGTTDLILGFPGWKDEADSSGVVYVISGTDGTVIRRSTGHGPTDHLGASLAFLGDVDGDGRVDYAVGAPQSNPHTTRRHADSSEPALAGYVSLCSGRDGSELLRLSGNEPGIGFGRHVAAPGDIDLDGVPDVVVGPTSRSTTGVFSGKTGKQLYLVSETRPTDPVGDVSGDGVPDLAVSFGEGLGAFVRFHSGRTGTKLFDLRYPDLSTEFAVTVGVGDMDGDGTDDVALGDPNFHLRDGVDLERLSLGEVLAIKSRPQSMSVESGCVLVRSGRGHHEVLWSIWGTPGSLRGMGLGVCPLDDITGDGYPDIVVRDAFMAYAFAGPGAGGE